MPYVTDGQYVKWGEYRAGVECFYVFFFSSRRRHTRLQGDWSSDVCSSDLWVATPRPWPAACAWAMSRRTPTDRKSTRLNSSHLVISYAVFCLKKKKTLLGGTTPWSAHFRPRSGRSSGVTRCLDTTCRAVRQ